MAETNLGKLNLELSKRPRRLRRTQTLRDLVRETRLSRDQLVMPYFVKQGKNICEEIVSMPGQFRYSVDKLVPEVASLMRAGVKSILLFGLPEEKDAQGSEAWSAKGALQTAVRALKQEFPELLVMTDVCLCAFTSHGHCGLISSSGEIENDSSVELLARVALSHAEAGSDMISPSDMMDGRVRAIRTALDQNEFEHVPIMSYAAKFASAFYGPFRDAAGSAPKAVSRTALSFPRRRESSITDETMDPRVKPEDDKVVVPATRQSYQMDPANSKEAIREMRLDLEEGADILMVKPAMAYLDIIKIASQTFDVPIAAYAVSGEYAMIKAAGLRGWIDEKAVMMEHLVSLKRAGADILITYFAKQAAPLLFQ